MTSSSEPSAGALACGDRLMTRRPSSLFYPIPPSLSTPRRGQTGDPRLPAACARCLFCVCNASSGSQLAAGSARAMADTNAAPATSSGTQAERGGLRAAAAVPPPPRRWRTDKAPTAWGRSWYPAAGPASVASNDALVSLSEQAFNNVGKYLQAELSSTRGARHPKGTSLLPAVFTSHRGPRALPHGAGRSYARGLPAAGQHEQAVQGQVRGADRARREPQRQHGRAPREMCGHADSPRGALKAGRR